MSDETDRIERSIVIAAPRERVWQSLADAETFGRWFQCNLAGQAFAPGRRARGPITTPGYEHVFFDVAVEQMEAGRLLSYRWHPYAIDPKVDYSGEPTTLVTFTLQDAADGTLLTVVESGFDALPPQRRDEAVRMNTGGWDAQLRNVQRHAAEAAG